MKFFGMSLDQAPPYFTTIKFFITAPFFLSLCGIFLMLGDSSTMMSLKSFEMLGVIHAFTLGFMALTMLGALQQMLPVIAGAVIYQYRLFSYIVYLASIIGAIALSSGFMLYDFRLLYLGGAIFGAGVVVFVATIIQKIIAKQFFTPTMIGILISAVILCVVAIFGNVNILSYGAMIQSNLIYSTIHIDSAIFGWIFLLIASISFQVIPMFYVGQSYHSVFAKIFVPSFILIVLCGFFVKYIDILSYLLAIGFGLYSMYILKNRKRKNSVDITLRHFYLGFTLLIVGCILRILLYFIDAPQISLISLILLLFGFGGGIVIGMLYKIVPFLTWFHLSVKGIFDMPSVVEMAKGRKIYIQFFFYIAFIISFCISSIFGAFFIPGALLVISSIFIIYNLYHPINIYIQKADEQLSQC